MHSSILSVVLLAWPAALSGAEALPVLTVPVRVHLLQSDRQPSLHTTLTESDVQRIFGKVNRIWAPAGIRFEVESVRKTRAVEPPPEGKAERERDRVKAAVPRESMSATAIDVCYVKQVTPNGFYYGEPVVVKDTASLREVAGGMDEPLPRVTAHELGHALGLAHRQDVTNLMASGTTGFALNEPEIRTARAKAAEKFAPTGAARQAAGDVVVRTPGLVAFWTFGEAAGQPRESIGTREKHPLIEVGGPIARVKGGPFSGWSAELNGKQYFHIPYARTGDLNISGPDAQVSMFAVVRIVDLKQSRTIAGMWSEGKGANDDSGTRQYALLMNMPTYGGPRQLVPHISSEGGVTRRADGSAFPWCADYAATRQEVPEEQWCTLGFTYDSKFIRAYLNGVLDARPLDPAKDRRTDRYFTHEGPAGGDRGMNPYYHGRGIFRYDPARHAQMKPGGGSDFTVGARYAVGKMLGEATLGRFGGLAVFNRALTEAEMKRLHDAANVAALP